MNIARRSLVALAAAAFVASLLASIAMRRLQTKQARAAVLSAGTRAKSGLAGLIRTGFPFRLTSRLNIPEVSSQRSPGHLIDTVFRGPETVDRRGRIAVV